MRRGEATTEMDLSRAAKKEVVRAMFLTHKERCEGTRQSLNEVLLLPYHRRAATGGKKT